MTHHLNRLENVSCVLKRRHALVKSTVCIHVCIGFGVERGSVTAKGSSGRRFRAAALYFFLARSSRKVSVNRDRHGPNEGRRSNSIDCPYKQRLTRQSLLDEIGRWRRLAGSSDRRDCGTRRWRFCEFATHPSVLAGV